MVYGGVCFKYKRNLWKNIKSGRSISWRGSSLGLDLIFTVKSKKEEKSKKKSTNYVGISYAKGVMTREPYTWHSNAERYCKIIIPRIDEGIQNSSSPRIKRILQDNCPVMNVTSAADALTGVGVMRLKITATKC